MAGARGDGTVWAAAGRWTRLLEGGTRLLFHGKPVRCLLLCRPASSAPVARLWRSGQAAACPIYLSVAPGDLLTPMAAVECLARRPRHVTSPPFRPSTVAPHPPLPPHPHDRCADANARVTSSLFAWTQPRRSAGH